MNNLIQNVLNIVINWDGEQKWIKKSHLIVLGNLVLLISRIIINCLKLLFQQDRIT